MFRFPDGTEKIPKSKEIIRDIPIGTVFNQKAGGGGGYGDPHRRTAEKVVEEVVNGYISIEAARRDYGVAIDPDTLELVEEETARLRGKNP